VVSLLSCRLETGRTHQIRVHLRSIGHPVVADERYRGRRQSLTAPRLFLHAADLGFHQAVAAACRNELFANCLQGLSTQIFDFMRVMRSLALSSTHARLRMVQDEHVQIYRAILQEDPDRARKEMRQHIDLRSSAKLRQASKLAEIREALVAAGFDTAAKQAIALGVRRPTAWALLNRDKRAGPSAKIIKRILCSPDLPSTARRRVEEYIQEKIDGVYGHRAARRRWFSNQFHN